MKTRSSLTSTRRQIPRSAKKDSNPKPSTTTKPVQQRRSMPAIKVATPNRKVAVPAKTVTTTPAVKRLSAPLKRIIPPAKVIDTNNVTQKDFLSGFNLIPPQQAIQIVQEQKRKRQFKVAQIQRNVSQKRDLLPPTRDVILNDRRKRPYSDIGQAPYRNGTSQRGRPSYPGNTRQTHITQHSPRFPHPALLKQFQHARLLPPGQHTNNRNAGLRGRTPFNRRSMPSIFNRIAGDPRRLNQGYRPGIPIAGPSGMTNGRKKKPLLDGEVIVLEDSDDELKNAPKANGHARHSLQQGIVPKRANGTGPKPMASIQPQAYRKSINIPIIKNGRSNRAGQKDQIAGPSRPYSAFRNGRVPYYVTSSREVELIPLGPDTRRSSSSSPSFVEEAEAVCEVLPVVHEPSIPEEQNPFPREVRPALITGRLENIRERGWIQRALMEEEQRNRIRDQMMLNCFDMHFSYAKMFMDLANRQLEMCREELSNRQAARSASMNLGNLN